MVGVRSVCANLALSQVMKLLLSLQIWLLHCNCLLGHQLPGILVRTQILGSRAQAPVFLRSSPLNPATYNCTGEGQGAVFPTRVG